MGGEQVMKPIEEPVTLMGSHYEILLFSEFQFRENRP
jgi:hypothetical protein